MVAPHPCLAWSPASPSRPRAVAPSTPKPSARSGSTGRQRYQDRCRERPEGDGVTCHVTYFDRSVIDRLKNGNWFEDPSNNSSPAPDRPIAIGDIDLSKEGRKSSVPDCPLIWKNLLVTRIYDKANDTLIYLAHSEAVDRRFRPRCRSPLSRSMASGHLGEWAAGISDPADAADQTAGRGTGFRTPFRATARASARLRSAAFTPHT